MTDKIIVLVTTGSLRESKKLARHLVESRLAACVNITPPIRSIYRWKGKLADDREYLLLIKTSRGLFDALRDAILKIHTYATPEIVSLPITNGSVGYLKWLEDSLARETGN